MEKKKRFIGAIDQGTSGTRFVLYNEHGQVCGSSYKEHRQIFPRPGWVEHDPIEIWENTLETIAKTLDQTKVQSSEIVGIGITNQRETTVVWDRKTGKPLSNAIVWQCTRTADICEEIKFEEGVEKEIEERSGLKVSTYFSGPKIFWLLRNSQKVRDKAYSGDALFGNIDTWLIWNLTGGPNGGIFITDYTNASRTMLMNLKGRSWDEELLSIMKVPESILPHIFPSSEVYGYAKIKSLDSVTIAGDIGDQQAALFGQVGFEAGDAKNTYGTGCFLLLNTGEKPMKSENGLLTTIAYGLETKVCYALEGSIAIAGAAIQWLRDQLGFIKSAAESEQVGSSVPDNGGVYFVPAFVGLFAPYWDPYARGTIVGLTRGSSKAHIVRACLEAICFQTKEILQAMSADSKLRLDSLKVDGGGSKNNFMMSLQASILGIPVLRPTVEETTSLGAAYAAGLATGFWEDLETLKENWSEDARFDPKMDKYERSSLFKEWKRAVDRARAWIQP